MAVQQSQRLIEVLVAASAPPGVVSQHLVEVLVALQTASPTSITGAGVSQHLIEVLVQATSAHEYITKYLVEVLLMPIPAIPPSGAPVTTGWVVLG